MLRQHAQRKGQLLRGYRGRMTVTYMGRYFRNVVLSACCICNLASAASAQDRHDVIQLSQQLTSGANKGETAVQLVKKLFSKPALRTGFFSAFGSPAEIPGRVDNGIVYGMDISELCECLCRAGRSAVDKGDEQGGKSDFLAVLDICHELLGLRPPKTVTDALTSGKVPGERRYQYVIASVTASLASMNFFSKQKANGSSGERIFPSSVRSEMAKLRSHLIQYRKEEDKLGGIDSGNPRVVSAFKAELALLDTDIRGVRQALSSGQLLEPPTSNNRPSQH